MTNDETQISLSDGGVRAWIEQETAHIKAVDAFGDPVELADHEVKELADALLKFCGKISG